MDSRTESSAAIEFHDSELLLLEESEGGVEAVLSAYVHRSLGRPGVDAGTGWSETAHLRVAAGRALGRAPGLPVMLADGAVEAGQETFSNVVPVVDVLSGPIRLTLRTVRGDTIVLEGRDLAVCLGGNPTYVEDFPGA